MDACRAGRFPQHPADPLWTDSQLPAGCRNGLLAPSSPATDSLHNNNLPRRRGTATGFWQLISLRYGWFLPGIATAAAEGMGWCQATLVRSFWDYPFPKKVTFTLRKEGGSMKNPEGNRGEQKNWWRKKCWGEKWGQHGFVWSYNWNQRCSEGWEVALGLGMHRHIICPWGSGSVLRSWVWFL